MTACLSNQQGVLLSSISSTAPLREGPLRPKSAGHYQAGFDPKQPFEFTPVQVFEAELL
jgi:hypothetical protein